MKHALRDDEHRLEMTPMIDVTFLLLIFFLCTLRFRALEGKLTAYLPKDAGSNVLTEPRDTLDVRIAVLAAGEKRDARNLELAWTGDGRYELVGRRLLFAVGARQTEDPAELARQLERLGAADSMRPVTIAPGRDTIYGDVVPVLDAVLEAGFEEISFTSALLR